MVDLTMMRPDNRQAEASDPSAERYKYPAYPAEDGNFSTATMAVKLLILLALAGMAACAGFQGVVAGLAKKIFVQSSSARYIIPVVTSLTTVPSTCFMTVNVTGNCRRRRSFQEKPLILSLDDEDVDIDTILPTLPR